MENIISYALAFVRPWSDEAPFSAVDSALLCQLAYLRLEACGLDAPGASMTVAEVAEHIDDDALFNHVPVKPRNHALLQAAGENPRFADIIVSRYITHFDPEAEQQFSAVTFRLPNGAGFIAFRGTDSTLVGWKEDLNMAFMPAVPSQLESVRYLEASALENATLLRVGGHSKGGNLAVYAAAECRPDIQARIMQVFSHDGPGFHPDFYQREGYRRVRERVCKTVPASSVIGMLMQQDNPYTVVQSTEHGIYQHSLLSWVVKDGAFATLDSLNRSAQLLDGALDKWMNAFDEAERRVFVDMIFDVLRVGGAQTVDALSAALLANSPAVLKAVSGVAPEKRKFFLSTVMAFWSTAGRQLLDMVRRATPQEEEP